MKTIKIKFLIVAIALLSSIGCSEQFLEVENKNSLLEDAYHNQEGMRKFEIAIFNGYKGNFNFLYQCFVSALSTEYFFHYPGGEGANFSEWAFLNPKPTNRLGNSIYGSFYNCIRLANITMNVAESKKNDIPEMDTAEYNRILGAAYFMRALCHYHVMSIYGKSFDPEDKWGIVIQTKQVVDRKDFQIPRSKPSEVYAQIISDFKKAQELLPLESDVPSEYLGHPTREAATAFLGKMYLIRKDYTAAKAEFESFFQMNPSKGLLPNFGDNFHGMFENGMESVFEVQYSDVIVMSDSWGDGAARPYQEFMGPSGLGRNNVLISDYFIQKFEKNDFRKIESAFSMDIDTLYRPDGTMFINSDSINVDGKMMKKWKAVDPVFYGPKKYINRFRDNQNVRGKERNGCNENENIMRVAEVFFMYAETCAETGDLAKAYEYMNKVRRRAFGYDPAIYSTSPFDFPVKDKQDFYTKLNDEFMKEFIGENLIWFNWVRWGIVADEASKTGRDFIVGTHEAMPIPDGELRTDQLVEQNPGYN
jgi:tetratricopeptide (TPR) repeat protein